MISKHHLGSCPHQVQWCNLWHSQPTIDILSFFCFLWCWCSLCRSQLSCILEPLVPLSNNLLYENLGRVPRKVLWVTQSLPPAGHLHWTKGQQISWRWILDFLENARNSMESKMVAFWDILMRFGKVVHAVCIWGAGVGSSLSGPFYRGNSPPMTTWGDSQGIESRSRARWWSLRGGNWSG